MKNLAEKFLSEADKAHIREAVETGSKQNTREELGDLLFVIANAARHLQVNSEAALNETSDKFERRFRFIEAGLQSQGKSPHTASLQEMDDLWDQAKSLEKGSHGGNGS